MKGPGHRLNYDLRRFWRCRQTRKERRTSGLVTALETPKSPEEGQPIWYELVEEKRPERKHRYALPEEILADIAQIAKNLAACKQDESSAETTVPASPPPPTTSAEE